MTVLFFCALVDLGIGSGGVTGHLGRKMVDPRKNCWWGGPAFAFFFFSFFPSLFSFTTEEYVLLAIYVYVRLTLL